ncbi:hypothetical protein BGW38_005624 [Lunasporangiospora selenospora]|uniref:CST complex subunit STN1 n=1 Tax=Lunasporangiospora selenospora TaxID=979761 RepID=A0A9P6FMU0_9FUNG|nr:hypothetical protein BGW38_005624 [Lunasporangiospora selenospora]
MPVMNVEIMGTVLYANQKSTSIVYTIDDGEDIIQCIVWIPDEFRMRQNTSNVPGLEFIEIGNVVRVMGELNNYMGAIQIVAQPGTISKPE